MKPQKTFNLSVPPRLSGDELDLAIAALEDEPGEVVIMAASFGFATPLDICGLRAVIDLAAIRADAVYLDCPASQDVHRYLARMDFYEGLPSNVTMSASVPKIKRKDRRQNLVELGRYSIGDDLGVFIESVFGVTKSHFDDGRLASACATALGAATENVLNHSESPIGALVAAQRYRTGLELAVVDLGQGIPTTLRRNVQHAHLSDIEAIEESLIDGVSCTGEPNRGSGMHELVTAIQRAGNSTMVIRSGRGHVTIGVKDGAAHIGRRTPAHEVRGTWISVRLEPPAVTPRRTQ
ncbi:MAG: hypothetical protein ACYDD4_05070 [Acidimicrobiales bacterium]